MDIVVADQCKGRMAGVVVISRFNLFDIKKG